MFNLSKSSSCDSVKCYNFVSLQIDPSILCELYCFCTLYVSYNTIILCYAWFDIKLLLL